MHDATHCPDCYAAGRAAALAELQTTEQIATRLGISPRRVRELAAAAGDLGRQVAPGRWLFRPEDVAALAARNRQVGRPTRKKLAS